MIRQHTTHTAETVAAALSCVPSDDRDTWIEMAMAVKSEMGDAGFDLWNEWSQSAENYKERDAKSVWKSIKEGGRITIGTLFYEAKQRGFKLNGQGKTISPAEWERIRQEREERQRIEAARKAKEEHAASLLAEQTYTPADAALPNHPYLVRKEISPAHGIKVGRWYQIGADGKRFREKENCLLVPMRDADGKLWNVQAIFPERDPELERDKDYLLGGRKQGTYFSIGKPEGVIVIAEGLATAISIRAATGLAACVAFDKGNLLPVGKALRERLPDVRLIFAADNDIKEGKPNYGVEKSAAAASEVGGYIAIPELDGKKADFNDLSQEKGPDAVKAAIEGAQPVTAPKEQPEEATIVTDETQEWPEPLSPEAFHGLAGEIVRTIEPQTESDEAAILVQVLVAFGALVGRGAHVRVEGDEHHPNLFALIVGDTSKARKGTSWSRVREIFSKTERWPTVVDGLSSGEGLKWAVRDRITKAEKDGLVEIDPGVSDKRILVMESEFAQVLRQCARAGNTLSSTLRCAWDGLTLQTLTKMDPVKATGSHVSIIGHITADELRAELTQTDSANGFANRFLFMCAKRAKLLPFGGDPLSEGLISQFASRLAKAAGTAQQRQQPLRMSQGARDIWAAVYPTLSEGQPGLFGAVTARAEAQALRLALMYALLDESGSIEEPHIMAALAIWKRSQESARCIFGASLGDPKADEIRRALVRAGDEGLTRTGISQLFNRHETAERIGAALELLRKRGLAYAEKRQTGGAPVETWFSGNAKQANKAKEVHRPHPLSSLNSLNSRVEVRHG